MPRPAIAVALPLDEQLPAANALAEAGFEPLIIDRPEQLEEALAGRADVAVAILDGETDFDLSLEYYALLHEGAEQVPALMVVSSRTLDRFIGAAAQSGATDEYFSRPYSAESLRWRVEAMLIRQLAVDDGSGPVLQGASPTAADWLRRGTFTTVFNPKGGVGKTTIALNLAASLEAMGRRVLLVDADTITGHIASSLGLEHVRTLVDAVGDADADAAAAAEPLEDLIAAHPSGLRVLVLSSSPLRSELLDPAKVAEALALARRSYDDVVVDVHPDYGPLNRAIFERADRILVPVTPDVPALRAAVQFRDVAGDLGIRDKLAMVVNRANSGVSVADMERTVGMPAMASIRSAGMLLVKAANEGRTVIDLYPREKVSDDFRALAETVTGRTRRESRAGIRGLFAWREAARAT
ncbi:MAG: AAA family ATPase [Chloroflexi bacterium]|nr:AAA family ATPase [Chloroflexota bacterium]